MRKLKSCQKRETRTTTAYKEEVNAGTCGNRKVRARSRETGRLQTAGFELMRDGTRSASYKNEAVCLGLPKCLQSDFWDEAQTVADGSGFRVFQGLNCDKSENRKLDCLSFRTLL